MSAQRLEIISLTNLSTPLTTFSVNLDCWKAELFVQTSAGNWFIDGTDVADMASGIAIFHWGGLVDGKGRPINFNQVLIFQASIPAPTKLITGIMTKTYYDPGLASAPQ